MLIYKVFRAAEWADMQQRGETPGAPVDLADGYIHLSTAAQLPGTLAKHFANETGLTLLACESDDMERDIRWEESRGGALFPHLYRNLRMSDVIWSREIALTDGVHITGVEE
ncbi:DUF952 domain-containing protein [Paracoccus sp. PARArs4]|uniref:DUF952 domain-containing protein n=1 Tax=Paracoccus sp. PARArs4 TaxID=2853442 RepID=UPI0024A77C91|nr:DUF952 domain-containing protein [Paracoccus sp. PARArs4]